MRKKNQWEREKDRIKDLKPSGLREKLGTVSCWDSFTSEFGTFRTPRYVCVKNWYLAGMWWSMFAVVLFYINLAVFYDYQYLGKTKPEVSSPPDRAQGKLTIWTAGVRRWIWLTREDVFARQLSFAAVLQLSELHDRCRLELHRYWLLLLPNG